MLTLLFMANVRIATYLIIQSERDLTLFKKEWRCFTSQYIPGLYEYIFFPLKILFRHKTKHCKQKKTTQ